MGEGDPLSPLSPAAPCPQRNQASAPWPRRHRPLQPRAAPLALGTGSARGPRSAAAADVATCAWLPNEVRRQSPEQQCHMTPGMLANLLQGRLWDGAAAGQALGTPGLQPSGCPEALGRWVPAARWGFRPCCPFLPLSDKPGECPKVKPRQTLEPCAEEDSCTHDRDCPRQEKCCFSGCAMRCTRPARGECGQPGHRHREVAHKRGWDPTSSPGSPCPTEHPGQCPRAEPCWDPRRRRRSQCLDDSVCRREEKCCDTGCGWECLAVPRGSGSSQSRGRWPPAPRG